MANRDIFGFVVNNRSGFKSASGSKCDCTCNGVKYTDACDYDEWAFCGCCETFCKKKGEASFSRATGGRKCRCHPNCDHLANNSPECAKCCDDNQTKGFKSACGCGA